MMALVTGGAASGKSAFAEQLALSLPGPHAYVATMRHGDGETEARIARHRDMRAGKGFVTIELADAGWETPAEAGSAERLEDQAWANRSSLRRSSCGTRSLRSLKQSSLTAPPSLVAAHDRSARRSALPASAGVSQPASASSGTALLEDLGNLVANGLVGRLGGLLAYDNLVIVANEVGCDGVCYDGFTMGYIEKLGRLACELAARSDVVVEVVAGIPNVVKGELPCIC